MKTLKKPLVVQAALAGLFAVALAGSAAAEDAPKTDAAAKPAPVKKAHKKMAAAEKVHCFGVNSCKGKSECAVDGKSQCKGQNACKGQGWVALTTKSCKAKKGTVAGEKPAAAPAAAPVKS